MSSIQIPFKNYTNQTDFYNSKVILVWFSDLLSTKISITPNKWVQNSELRYPKLKYHSSQDLVNLALSFLPHRLVTSSADLLSRAQVRKQLMMCSAAFSRVSPENVNKAWLKEKLKI